MDEEFARVVNVDTTVQDSAIAFPTDARLYHKARGSLVRMARGMSDCRDWRWRSMDAMPMIDMQHARREQKRLKTNLDRVIRDIFRFKNAELNMQHKSSARFLIYTLLTFALTGCAISKEIYLFDGTKGHSISCDGSAVGINVCFEKAGNLCGSRGYDLLSREGQIIPMGIGSSSVSGNNGGFQGQSFVSYGSFNTKSIMIRCRN